MTKKNVNGGRKNLRIMKEEIGDVLQVWRTTHADQPGWTHEVMQKARDLARHAPVTTATLLVVLIIALVVALVN